MTPEERYQEVREKIIDIIHDWEFGAKIDSSLADQILKKVYVPHPDQSLPVNPWCITGSQLEMSLHGAYKDAQQDMSDFKRVIK